MFAEKKEILIAVAIGLAVFQFCWFLFGYFVRRYFVEIDKSLNESKTSLEKETERLRYENEKCINRIKDDIRSIFSRLDKLSYLEKDVEWIRKEHDQNHSQGK